MIETWDSELDARGLLCPLPVLKARRRLMAMAPGEVLRLVCDDPAALVDIPHFCAEQGHGLIGQVEIAHPAHAWLIRRRETDRPARGPAQSPLER